MVSSRKVGLNRVPGIDSLYTTTSCNGVVLQLLLEGKAENSSVRVVL